MSQGFSKSSPNVIGSGPTDIFINGVKQTTTSGSSVDFTVPSGVKQFSITFKDVSNSGTGSQNMLIQLGDAGGVETSGYTGTVARSTATTNAVLYDTDGFLVTEDAFQGSANLMVGIIHFVLHDAATNTWVAQGQVGRAASAGMAHTAGSKALSGELTTVRVINDGSHTFDAGSINIQYDNPDPTTLADSNKGKVLQFVHNSDSTYQSYTNYQIPDDDTIPQSSEGVEVMTCSITPKKADSVLKIDVIFDVFSMSAINELFTMALFQDSGTDAIATGYGDYNNGNWRGSARLTYIMTAGTTDSTTFKVRVGGNLSTSDIYLNGSGAARRFGGTASFRMLITEIAA